MKKSAVVLFVIFFMICGGGRAYADAGRAEEILEDTLHQMAAVEVPHFDFAGTAESLYEGRQPFGLGSVLGSLGDMLFSAVSDHISLLIKILVLSILAGVLCNLQQSLPGENVAEISFLACLAVIAGLSAGMVSELMEQALTTIDSLLLFMQSMLPAVGGLSVSANSAVLSGFYPALFLSMQSFTLLCKNVFLPFIMMITALSVVNAMSNRFHITRLIEFTQQTVKWGMGILLTVYVGLLSLRGIAVTVTGGVAGRTVKYALCNFIPLVGGVLAESAEMVIASVRTIRGAVGVSGVLAIISLCAAPLCKMFAVSVLYKFAAGIAEPATDKRIIKLLTDFSGQITLILIIVLMVCVMFIISVAMLCLLL